MKLGVVPCAFWQSPTCAMIDATLFVFSASRMSGIKTPSLPGVRAMSSTWLIIEKRPDDDILGGLSTEHLQPLVRATNTEVYGIVLLWKFWICLGEGRLKAVCELVEDIRDLGCICVVIWHELENGCLECKICTHQGTSQASYSN